MKCYTYRNGAKVHKYGWKKRKDALIVLKRMEKEHGREFDLYKGKCGLYHIGKVNNGGT